MSINGFIHYAQLSPVFVILLVGILVWVAARVVQSTVALQKADINEAEFVPAVSRYLAAGNIEAGAKECDKRSEAAMSRATKTLLKLLKIGCESPMLAVEESMASVRGRVMNGLDTLSALANLATLVGLVGTVVGLIGAFSATTGMDAQKKGEFLSASISEAMYNTFSGLAVAVMALFAHMLLSHKAKSILERSEAALFQLVNVHAQYKKGYRPPETAAKA
ncbi:MAG: MotA/TolQ/ExbB proton channel family protein [Pseudomonadota bacterium]|jgi:biopolymer transport protein ExbB